MKEVETISLSQYGDEVRVGINHEGVDMPDVTLSMNHFENSEEWGAQPLTPGQARCIASLLIRYADYAENIVKAKFN